VLTVAGLAAIQVCPHNVRTLKRTTVVKRTVNERAQMWVVDYSAARARAIRWLGDRYLLAKPVNAQRTLLHSVQVTVGPAKETP